MTREQIESLKIGDYVKQTFDTDGQGIALSNARYGQAREVIEITARGTDKNGLVFVCFTIKTHTYEDGKFSTLSTSIKEGKDYFIIA